MGTLSFIRVLCYCSDTLSGVQNLTRFDFQLLLDTLIVVCCVSTCTFFQHGERIYPPEKFMLDVLFVGILSTLLHLHQDFILNMKYAR